ncbi:lysoplasmalogenase [Psychroserpens sp. NJDZ02]|uniref:lysoplasmalogenase n=1 Tax=Psychroserpens sp. NJDZ02 TaxID=2570561 RepID=UPI0010A8FCAD|nr:lysoplasmalogenase [Psychroserpens sp. NJDZ02]QCE42220.1 lysoplasmalogenase [Psychroserpens sp. NJDZ02]
MPLFFKKKLYLSLSFFLVLGIDLYFKTSDNPIYFRYFSKSLIIIMVFLYFSSNNHQKQTKDKFYILGLLFFWIGDILLLLYETPILYILGMLSFSIGKLLYSKRFSHQNDFKMSSLLPFFIVVFAYTVIIILYIYDNLGRFFMPSIIYLFTAMLLGLFVILRKDAVNKKSFYLIMIAFLCSIISDTAGGLESFYNPGLPFHEIIVMLFYGLFQYFVVVGLTSEKTIVREDYQNNFVKI